MDKHVLHNIIHRDAGNESSRCCVCNGEISADNVTAMEAKCNDILKRQQGMGGMYDEKKGMKVAKEVLAHPVYAFGEDVSTLPTEIMLVPIGKWNTTKYGEVEITKEMLVEMKKHFDDGVRKGVMIDIDHGQSQYGDAAGGWIKEVEVRADGLWATELEWTPLGKEQVQGKMYRFLSPEFDSVHIDPENQDKMYDNVLIATSLVNRPLLKEIPALTFSEDGKKLTENKMGVMLFIDSSVNDLPEKTMDPKEILKKALADRSAEEVEFLKTAELSEEQKAQIEAENKPADPPADTTISAKEGKITVDAKEFDELKKNAEAGKLAFAEMEKRNIEAEYKAFEFNEKGGKYSPAVTTKVVAFASKLSPAMRVEFSEIIKELPDKKLFGEAGHDGDAEPTTTKVLADEITKYAHDNKMTFTEALKAMKKAEPAKFKDYEANKGQ